MILLLIILFSFFSGLFLGLYYPDLLIIVKNQQNFYIKVLMNLLLDIYNMIKTEPPIVGVPLKSDIWVIAVVVIGGGIFYSITGFLSRPDEVVFDNSLGDYIKITTEIFIEVSNR